MPRTPGLTQADIEARWRHIEELSRRGYTVRQISEQLDISDATVKAVRARAGLTRYQRKLTGEEIAKIDRMLADGCSLAEAARTFGVSRSTIWKRFPGRGWTHQQVGEWCALLRQLRMKGAEL